MSTFCAIDDKTLVAAIGKAKRRIVFIAPGVFESVAVALGKRFKEIGGLLDITVIVDPDEEVCRSGYGDEKGLKRIHELAQDQHFGLRSQPGLRMGVLLADDELIVWAPTPRSIEAPPASAGEPNGLFLGANPGKAIAEAVAAEGTNTDPSAAEIGLTAMTPEMVAATLGAIEKNPIIPVDLARITRVFSSKLQFVEFRAKGANFSRSELKVSKDLINVDIQGTLSLLIDSSMRAFGALRNEPILVPVYTSTGEAAFDANGAGLTEPCSEARLGQIRSAIERDFLFAISGHGKLMERSRRVAFEKRVKAFETQLLAHAAGIRKLLDAKIEEILDGAVTVILRRMNSVALQVEPDPNAIRAELKDCLKATTESTPEVTIRYKDVTYEHTLDPEFNKLVFKAVPEEILRKLGAWVTHFDAVREATTRSPGANAI